MINITLTSTVLKQKSRLILWCFCFIYQCFFQCTRGKATVQCSTSQKLSYKNAKISTKLTLSLDSRDFANLGCASYSELFPSTQNKVGINSAKLEQTLSHDLLSIFFKSLHFSEHLQLATTFHNVSLSKLTHFCLKFYHFYSIILQIIAPL